MNINAVIQPAGFMLPVSLQLYELLMAEAGEIPAHKHRITAVTFNFRDPDYSVERGGYHPVETRSWRKSSISVGRRAMSGTTVRGICL